MKVIDGVKRTRSLNGSISIFIAHGKLDEFWFDFLAGLKSGAIADDHQVALVQTGENFVFVRRFQTKFDRALFNLIVVVDDINRVRFFSPETASVGTASA